MWIVTVSHSQEGWLSCNLLGDARDYGVVRVMRVDSCAKAHTYTKKGWEPRDLDQIAENIVRHHLRLVGSTPPIFASSQDATFKVKLEYSIFDGLVPTWSSTNDVGETVSVSEDDVPVEVRCGLLAACLDQAQASDEAADSTSAIE